MRTVLNIALAIALATPVLAQEFRSSNSMRVNAAGESRFVVSGVPRRGHEDVWCAAGEYAQRVLGLSAFDRLYVVGNRQPGQRSYTFSPSPAGTASKTTRINSRSIRVDGANLRIGAAREECIDQLLFR